MKRTTHELVLEAIRAKPGIHKMELCEALGLSWGTVSFHVAGLITSGHVEKQTRKRKGLLFAKGMRGRFAALVASLRQHEARDVLLNVGPQGVGIQDLSDRLHLSRKVVRRILTEFVNDGLLQREPGLRGKYSLSDPSALALGLLESSHPDMASSGPMALPSNCTALGLADARSTADSPPEPKTVRADRVCT